MRWIVGVVVVVLVALIAWQSADYFASDTQVATGPEENAAALESEARDVQQSAVEAARDAATIERQASGDAAQEAHEAANELRGVATEAHDVARQAGQEGDAVQPGAGGIDGGTQTEVVVGPQVTAPADRSMQEQEMLRDLQTTVNRTLASLDGLDDEPAAEAALEAVRDLRGRVSAMQSGAGELIADQREDAARVIRNALPDLRSRSVELGEQAGEPVERVRGELEETINELEEFAGEPS
jgi:hypothetical protein